MGAVTDSTGYKLHGRRKGPGLSRRKKRLLAEELPRVAIALPPSGAGPLDPATLFARPLRDVSLEIGFGKGEHLIAAAAAHPDTGFVGCEPYLNGLVAGLDRLLAAGLDNVRLFGDDARLLLDALADASLGRIELIHPDPWPKRRHRKRRFICQESLDRMARVLRPGGHLLVVTDDPVYRQWTAIQMSERRDFNWCAEGPDDWRRPPADWTGTRYAEKAERAGRCDVFLLYRRC
ncbi:MAG: tRNA (guanine(46)-N(7))-methyltransferase TrmB [Rhodothalassiaceae bacterium]